MSGSKWIWPVVALVLIPVLLVTAGCSGATGSTGIQGTPGPQGPQGMIGPQGPQGPAGPEGPEGEQGPRGVAGEDGRDGDDGRNGSSGSKGNTGATGPVGPAGPQGEQGLAGTNGTDGDPGLQGIPGEDGEARAFLFLAKKDNDWDIVPGGMWACISYVPFGNEFRFSINAYGLETCEYSLIYYADPWPGSAPGKLIDTFDSDGSIEEQDISIELDMSLPCSPDENISGDYSGAPDYYAHARGAKLWLVPSECYGEPDVTTWTPARFLFEMDLITYVDTNCGLYSPAS